jgi:nitrite reductase (NADH) large subunit
MGRKRRTRTVGVMKKTLVVVGNGMVGQKLVDLVVEAGSTTSWRIVVLGEEPRAAYDRVHLSSYFDGCTADDLSMVDPQVAAQVEMYLGERITNVDRHAKSVITASGSTFNYDALVLATGSTPFVPPIDGATEPGCFVYRTIEDLDSIRSAAADAGTGIVVGGGLLGLEAANALLHLGIEVHVVEMAPRLMPMQLDERGAQVLRNEIEDRGIHVHTGATTTAVIHAGGSVQGVELGDGSILRAELVVFSAGIRPRDEIARWCDLAVGPRGGVAIDDTCHTSDQAISAIGECASHAEKIYGLVAPGYAMARVVADRLAGGAATFTGADTSTKLKLLGVDVASFGDAHGETPGTREVVWHDPVDRVYRKLVIDADGTRLLGGILVGDAADYAMLQQLCLSEMPLPGRPSALAAPNTGDAPSLGVAAIPDTATICTCNNVTKGSICLAVGAGAITIGGLKTQTLAGTGCGSCVPLVKGLLEDELTKAGIEVDHSLCEHFAHTRQELFDIIRVARIRTFGELLQNSGTGRGCEVCKPAVASMLASLWNEHVLSDDHASLQDTNDMFLANLQRDGTYSVIPRVPGGEIAADQLIVLGNVASQFDLYCKITGGQRIDLLGARVDQLPEIWRLLIDAGFESGHAYGKALRTVKSCVGTNWCRYGVQDSTKLAIDLELRYRGLRSPHKIKSAVSGCSRECAEAQSKDFGIIATDKGWNLYICGNGGMRPQHAVLLGQDLDTDTLVRYIDRFLMFYIRTGDRLERTATWLNRLPGGIEYVRQVVIDDSLGICDQLEAEMARHIATYQCEWKTTIEDPDQVARFTHFVNSSIPDPTLAYRRERGQRRPLLPDERTSDERTSRTPVSITAGDRMPITDRRDDTQ